jgi:DNA-directed RNA polymerase specialized sigma24 family protein
VARAKRELVLRANRHRGRWEDLEDCYSQATLELVAHTRRGATFVDQTHLGNTLELRFSSRVRDMRRALAGRSPIQMALAGAVSLGGPGEQEMALADRRAEVERRVLLREELRRIEGLADRLTADQALVLACQVAQIGCADFCREFGWSREKYRKVAQRGRRRLAHLLAAEQGDLEPAAAEGAAPSPPRTVPPRRRGRREQQGPAYELPDTS